MTRVSLTERVELGARSTDIAITTDLVRGLWDTVRLAFPDARRCGLAIDEKVAGLCPLPAAGPDLEVLAMRLPEGERAKTRGVLADLQDRWIDLRRDEPVIVMGGGAALDVGGLAAATVRRGLPWVAVATTVVAMADASVGGKTAINHARGKNLLGAFHPPRIVLADVGTLATLAPREVTAGLAEVYKAGRIGDPELVAALRRGAPGDASSWESSIRRAVAVKARLVEADERDTGARRTLNYGHTVGHALERVLGNEAIRHGEAVAIGMDAAAGLAVRRGLLTAAQRTAQREDLKRLGLPVDMPAGVDGQALREALGLDKKRAAGAAHVFVLPVGDSGVQVVQNVSDAEVASLLPS